MTCSKLIDILIIIVGLLLFILVGARTYVQHIEHKQHIQDLQTIIQKLDSLREVWKR